MADSEDAPRWGLKGKFTACWHAPVTIKGLGDVPLVPEVTIAPGQTIEFWLVVDAKGEHYEWKWEGDPGPAGDEAGERN